MRAISLATILAGLFVCGGSAFAVGPADVVIVINKNVPESRHVAEHYCKKRGVPKENIVALDVPKEEDISRADFNAKMVAPLREALKERKDKVTVLLAVYGVPLRVGRAEPTAEDKKELEKLKPDLDKVMEELKTLLTKIAELEKKVKDNAKSDEAKELPKLRQERDALQTRQRGLEKRQRHLQHAESEACVDSELTLLWREDYELRRFLLNIQNFQVPEGLRKDLPPVVLTARLDGPTPAIAKGLIDMAVEIEQKGLEGKVYVDARGTGFDPKQEDGFGYSGYDESLREMARLLKTDAKLDVTLDDKPELFASGSCPDCALYCGWYSLANYVDCCKFVRGAVAYHIASSEAVSLRNADSKLWCKCLLENGVAATLGPVAEPYTVGFPKPAEFFGFLVTGEYTLVECYHRTMLLSSWMTVLVGDPLYNPYAKTPKLKSEQVKPSPKGGKSPVK